MVQNLISVHRLSRGRGWGGQPVMAALLRLLRYESATYGDTVLPMVRVVSESVVSESVG